MVVAFGAAVQVNPFVFGDAQPPRFVDRCHYDRRALIDQSIGVEQPRIGVRDPAVLTVDRGQPRRRKTIAAGGQWIVGCHVGEACKQRRHHPQMILHPATSRVADRVFDQRVHHDRRS